MLAKVMVACDKGACACYVCVSEQGRKLGYFPYILLTVVVI